MRPTRREFLLTASGVVVGALDAAARDRLCQARGLFTDPALDEIVRRTLDAAKKAGASYADLRVVRRRSESIHTREDRVLSVGYGESYGVGVRVIADGAWGFAATSRVEPKEAERAARLAVDIAKENARVVRRKVELAPVPPNVDVWQTPLLKDPFKLQPADKAELLLAINREALKVPGVKYCHASFAAHGEWKLLASTDGCYIEQDLVRVAPSYSVTVVDDKSGEFVSRRHEIAPAQAGWEYVEQADLVGSARKIGEDAVEKMKAPSVTPGPRDLILAPSNLWLTIHESVGHPTELDRAMGYEANFAGTSFATPDKLGKLSYAAPQVTIYADRTTPGALATCGYDDDGVRTGRWDLVRDGRFVGYQTTREQAAWIGERESRGTSYAQDYKSFPFQRMPNVSLRPGGKDLGAADLIAATDDGIYITGDGSWSIDHQRYNFQFGGQMFYEIKKGRVTRALKDVAYQSNTLDFWHACDLVGGAREWRLGGSLSDGKGEPGQSNSVSHGCPPARFRRVNILCTKTPGGAARRRG